MFFSGEVWNPVDLYKVDMPEHPKEKQLAKAVKQAIRFLEAQGLKASYQAHLKRLCPGNLLFQRSLVL